MEHEFALNMEYQAMSILALIVMSLASSEAMSGERFLRRFAALVARYAISAAPVAVLVYMLYVVSKAV